jgi:hypothetical protein
LKIDNEHDKKSRGVQFALACDVIPNKSAIGIDHAMRGHGENAAWVGHRELIQTKIHSG